MAIDYDELVDFIEENDLRDTQHIGTLLDRVSETEDGEEYEEGED